MPSGTHLGRISTPFWCHFGIVLGFMRVAAASAKKCTPMVREPHFCMSGPSRKSCKRSMVSSTVLERLRACKIFQFGPQRASQMATKTSSKRNENNKTKRGETNAPKSLQKKPFMTRTGSAVKITIAERQVNRKKRTQLP